MANGWTPIILALVLLALLTAIGVYDVLVSYRVIPGCTVSSVIHDWSQQFPVMPFAIGLLIGHLLWPVGRRT